MNTARSVRLGVLNRKAPSMPILRIVSSCTLFAVLVAPSHAQSFNIDVGIPPGPSAGYGAGAGQLGTYNVFRIPPTPNGPLFDINGVPTTVTMTASGGAGFTSLANLPSPTVDDISFMSDVLDIGGNTVVWTISNLADGDYDIYVHAMAPDSAAYFTNVSVAGSPDPLQSIGGAWPAGFVLGVTHAKHHVTVVGGAPVLVTTVTAPPGTPANQGSVNGIQIVAAAPPNGTAICSNDSLGSDHNTVCPCGNVGGPGNGCGHSFDPNGANLSVTGVISADTIVLHSQFEPESSFTLMMQHANPGDTIFHDGVLCAGNPLIRLRGRAAVAGEAFFPNSNFAQDQTTTLSLRGGTFPGSGATMRYAAWFRNASSTFCPPATANVTNGWAITW